MNVVLPDSVRWAEAALVEPLGCVVHAFDRLVSSPARYVLSGPQPVRTLVIPGAGSSGLLFLPYLTRVLDIQSQIIVVDRKSARLRLASQLGAIAVDSSQEAVLSAIDSVSGGQGAEVIIEATGAGAVFQVIPAIARKQATLLLYGAGHGGLPDGCLTPLQSMELNVVTTAGASGGFDRTGMPLTYRRAVELIQDHTIDAGSLISHRYARLADVPQGILQDSKADDYIKGVYCAGS